LLDRIFDIFVFGDGELEFLFFRKAVREFVQGVLKSDTGCLSRARRCHVLRFLLSGGDLSPRGFLVIEECLV
jgi:hypothetical protein